MPITHKTRFFTSDMADAPVMTTGAGGIIAVLDGCLLNGFNTKTLSSLSVTSGVATATVSGGHGYSQYVIIEISGSSISALNGTHRVATVPNSTTFTFDATGVANGTATGTITAIMSTPTGWTKAFSGTNKAAYKSSTSASGCYFRIDDSGAYYEQQPVRGYESMSNVDTGTAPFPTLGGLPNFNWRRSTDATGNRAWALVADDQFVYLFVQISATDTANAPTYFGDFVSFDDFDPYACIISGVDSFTSGAQSYRNFTSDTPFVGSSWTAFAAIAREYGSIAPNPTYAFIANIGSTVSVISAASSVNTSDASVAGGFLIARGGVLFDYSGKRAPRGTLPEFYTSLIRPNMLIPSNHSVRMIDGRLYMCSRVWQSGGAQDGFVAVGLDGWR